MLLLIGNHSVVTFVNVRVQEGDEELLEGWVVHARCMSCNRAHGLFCSVRERNVYFMGTFSCIMFAVFVTIIIMNFE